MLKCVIFDFFGTLCNLMVDWKSTIRDITDEYVKEGVPPEVFEGIPGVAEKLVKVYDYMLSNFGKEKANRVHGKVSRIFEDYEVAGVKNAVLLPHVRDSLKTIKKMRLKIGLVSGNSKRSVIETLKKFNLESYFDSTVTRDSPGRMKPHPDQIMLCLKELGCKPEEAISIGDQARDIIALKKARVFAVALEPNLKEMKKHFDEKIVMKKIYEPLVKNCDKMVGDLSEFTELVVEKVNKNPRKNKLQNK